jgi:DNA-binding MarR family transcriptional regulator
MPDTKNDIVAEFMHELIRVNTAFRQYIQAMLRRNNMDLTFEMLQVLACLWNTDGVNQQEIANLTVKDKASVTYLLDNLTKRGLVVRKEDGDDRRNKLVFLTDAGRALKTEVAPWIQEMHTFAGLDMPMQAIKDCIGVMVKLRENLGMEASSDNC